MFFSPVGLHEDGVDLGQINGAGLVPDVFEQGSQCEVALIFRQRSSASDANVRQDEAAPGMTNFIRARD